MEHAQLIGWALGVMVLAQAAVLTLLSLGVSSINKMGDRVTNHCADRELHAPDGVGRLEIDQRIEALTLVVSALKEDTIRWFDDKRQEAMPRQEIESRLRALEVVVSGLYSPRKR